MSTNTPITLTRGTGDLTAVAYITLNRPEKHNGLTLDMLESLARTSRKIRRDRSIRAVIIRGAGPSFSAGLDFASVLAQPGRIAGAFLSRPWRGTNTFQEGPWSLRRLPVPVIAAVHGNCFGGGVQIALAADFRITTPNATWSVLEAKWGLIPDMSGIQSMSQLMPIDVAKRLAMSGEEFSGNDAETYGLASSVAEDPVAAAEELARMLMQRSPDSVASAKMLFDETWTRGARATFARERWRQARLLLSRNTRIAQKAASQAKGAGADGTLQFAQRQI